MNQEYKLYRISQLLSRFREQVKILNSNGEFSINKHAENIIIKVLNVIYDCNLENVNYKEGMNYSSIDLRDKVSKIAIQVTSTANIEKVKYTLSKFIEKELYKEFKKLYIFIITEKQARYNQNKIDGVLNKKILFKAEDILDKTDLYNELNSQNNLEKIDTVNKLLEEQFADKVTLDKWDIYCKGLNDYDHYTQNLYNYLDIKGFSPRINNTLVKIKLEKIYVPLELKVEFDEIKELEDSKNNQKKINYSIEKAIYDFNNLVILGDPGSGKSTILKYLAYNICFKRSINSQFSELVPVLIKGTEYAKYFSTNFKGLAEFIIDHLDKKYEFLFTEKLEKNKLIVLINGIDEINKIKLRHDVVNRINAFIAQYPEIKIIVSSRIIGYRETRLNGYFNHFQIMKFQEDGIKQFVRNWYLSIATSSDNNIEIAKIKAEELFNSIKQNQSVFKMASNPLLVTIIALIHFQGNTLPEKRASLYEIATSTFLENWVRQREIERSSNFDKDTLIEMLAPIAFNIHLNYTTGLISENEFKTLLSNEYKKINPYLSPKEEKADIKDIIEFLREDAGFLFEKGNSVNGEPLFGFVHKTFQEYFAAIEFVTRWKEGVFKENLDSFVFSFNWREVIVLAALLFRLNDQTRVGRKNTSNFIRDILNINDLYPEIYRPLKVILMILKDDAEIEFSLFIEFIDKILKEILINDLYLEKEPLEFNKEVSYFRRFLGDLLDTKTYKNYLIERFIKEINDSTNAIKLVNNLMYILINKSNVPDVHKELIKILKSRNDRVKECMFNYNTVSPVADIIKTKEFREEIIKYINSEMFISNYDGYLPAQYEVCFDISNRVVDVDYYSKGRTCWSDFSNKFMEERILSIKLIKNNKIRTDFINHYVFSIGFDSVEGIQKFLECAKKEFPDIKLPKIEKHIEYLTKLDSLKLSEYKILELNSVKIYSKKDDESKFAFIKDNEIVFFNYPFKYNDLFPHFKEDTESLLIFLSFIIPIIDLPKKTISISSVDDLLIFIKYNKFLDWHIDLDIEKVVNYALDCIIDNNIVDKSILYWLKNNRDIYFKMFKIDEKFSSENYKTKINSLNIESYDKLYLFYLIGEKSSYINLIRPTIEKLNTSRSEDEKNEIRKILYKVLE